MPAAEDDISPQRRRFFRTVTLIPAAAVGLTACSDRKEEGETSKTTVSTTSTSDYRPTFFNAAEWAFILAAVEHLLPNDELGAGAIEAGVPEFLDRHMNTPYAAGDIWYMQGPFLEASPQFGYQGRLALRDILRVGIKSFDAYCSGRYQGKTFAQLDAPEQLRLLKLADTAKLELADIPAKTFFDNLLNETKNGYFADPRHGGNKNMAGWKAIDYPGMRADYIDWVEVRDRPYPLPAVDLADRRA